MLTVFHDSQSFAVLPNLQETLQNMYIPCQQESCETDFQGSFLEPAFASSTKDSYASALCTGRSPY